MRRGRQLGEDVRGEVRREEDGEDRLGLLHEPCGVLLRPVSGEPFQTEYGVSLSPGVECELHMYDSYGDGWNGASWSGLGQEGLTFAAGLEERKYFVVPFAPPSPPPSPPSPPPLPPQLPPPPLSPLPPLLPGEAVAHTPQDIQDEINEAVDQGRNATVYVPPGASLAFKSDVECDGNIHLSVRSSGEGATLDGKKNSRMFYIKKGCSLYLEALHFVDGRGVYGGAVEARNAGDIAMKDVSFKGCEADLVRLALSPTHRLASLALAIHERRNGCPLSRMPRCGWLGRPSPADAPLPPLAQHGGAMFVHLSGDVSMESAGFSSCTSAKVRQSIRVTPHKHSCRGREKTRRPGKGK